MNTISAVLLLVAGLLGAAPVDGRLAWVCAFLAGLFIILPI